MKTTKVLSRILLTTALAGGLALAVGSSLSAEPDYGDACHQRLENDKARIDHDAARHGNNSPQVHRDVDRMENDRSLVPQSSRRLGPHPLRRRHLHPSVNVRRITASSGSNKEADSQESASFVFSPGRHPDRSRGISPSLLSPRASPPWRTAPARRGGRGPLCFFRSAWVHTL
jgi:hypothetical protein